MPLSESSLPRMMFRLCLAICRFVLLRIWLHTWWIKSPAWKFRIVSWCQRQNHGFKDWNSMNFYYWKHEWNPMLSHGSETRGKNRISSFDWPPIPLFSASSGHESSESPARDLGKWTTATAAHSLQSTPWSAEVSIWLQDIIPSNQLVSIPSWWIKIHTWSSSK